MTDAEKLVAKTMAKAARDQGFEYTAKYIERYGPSAWNPHFTRGMTPQTEAFYKACVEGGHKWDRYVDPPEEVYEKGDLY